MNCYIMNRKGSFKTPRATNNQCKVKGHKKYHYDIVVAFSNRIKLDDNKFIIDHQEIDDCIQKCSLIGSCEEMHLTISKQLKILFKSKKIPVMGIRAVIYPNIPVGVANLSYIWTAPKAKNILSLLTYTPYGR